MMKELTIDEFKKRIRAYVDKATGEYSINTYDGKRLIEEVKTSGFTVQPGKSYIESQNENISHHRFWKGYTEFIEADRSNKQAVMAKVKPLIETWFMRGVTYDTAAFGFTHVIKYYTDEPAELHSLLAVSFFMC